MSNETFHNPEEYTDQIDNNLLEEIEGTHVQTDPNGDVHFLDPMYGEPISPDVPPRCVMEDEAMRLGFAYLKGRGSSLTVRLVLSTHGDADDFTRARELYPQVFDNPGVFGVETDWEPTDDANVPPCRTILTKDPGRRSFQEEQLRYLNEKGATILPCEYYEAGQTPLGNMLLNGWAMYEKFTEETDIPIEQRNALRTASIISYQICRQWAMIGQLGNHLYQLDLADLLLPHEPVTIMLGSWHAQSESKLRDYIGATTEVYNVPFESEPSHKQHGQIFMDAIRKGKSTVRGLALPVPY